MIQVGITRTRTRFLWGIDQNEIITTPFKLFKPASASPLVGPINSFQVHFTINGVVPEGSLLKLTLSTGAAGAIEHSIFTNLPVKSGSAKVLCSFEVSTSSIICTNIGAFLD